MQIMGLDRQVCQKCGHVYAERSITGPDFIVEQARSREGSKMCAYCGGTVRWMSQNETEELSELYEMTQVTLWDKIKLILGLGLLLSFGIAAMGQYLGWWKIWSRVQ
jgi:hypothetical protein